MALVSVRPTEFDVTVANGIAAHTGPHIEEAAGALTWGADEHILCALAAAWWLFARNKSKKARLASDHVLLTTLVASALPHLLKTVFDQERPDRLTVRGHWRGIPFSGNRLHAVPLGGARPFGALAFAGTHLSTKQRNAAWGLGLGLMLTRIVLLAHWTSDVAVGFGVGVLIERILRCFTGYGGQRNF